MIEEDYMFSESMKSDRTFLCGRIDITCHKNQEAAVRRAEKRLRSQSSIITSPAEYSEVTPTISEDSFDTDYIPSPTKVKTVHVDNNRNRTITTLGSCSADRLVTEENKYTSYPRMPLQDSLLLFMMMFMLFAPTWMVRSFYYEKLRLQ